MMASSIEGMNDPIIVQVVGKEYIRVRYVLV